MPELTECARCGRRFVAERAQTVAGAVVCPGCAPEARAEAAAAAAAEETRRRAAKASVPPAVPRARVWRIPPALLVGLGLAAILAAVAVFLLAQDVPRARLQPPAPAARPARMPEPPKIYRGLVIGDTALRFPDPIAAQPDASGRLRYLWKVGHVGRIKIGTILQIAGPWDMLVEEPEGFSYACPGSILRCKGWSTAGLVDRQRWQPQPPDDEARIVGTYSYTTVNGGSRTVLLAMPERLVARGLNPDEFRALSE